MKYLKTFEDIGVYINVNNADQYKDLLRTYRFKPGDHVKFDNLEKIYKVKGINTNDPYQPYEVVDENGITYPTHGRNLELVPDYEVDAIKYNL